MARGPCTFRQRDLTRAIRGAVAAGQIVERACVDADGRITLGFATKVTKATSALAASKTAIRGIRPWRHEDQ
jgi:hypothetical protein